MRAKEFIVERQKGPISKRFHHASTGIHTFGRSNFDNTYDLHRVMMAVAQTDGTKKPDIDEESWAAKHNTAHPYTYVEQQMLELAYDAAGIPFVDLNKGDLESKELPNTNIQSPIKAFKGYKK
jgi:hypothetical protein